LVGKKDSLTIQQFKEGTFITSYETFKILLHGVPFIIKEIEIDNEKVDLANFNTKENSIVVSKEFTEIHIIG
jgi:alpha-glucosidase